MVVATNGGSFFMPMVGPLSKDWLTNPKHGRKMATSFPLHSRQSCRLMWSTLQENLHSDGTPPALHTSISPPRSNGAGRTISLRSPLSTLGRITCFATYAAMHPTLLHSLRTTTSERCLW